ncbi:MAG: hypothetical protein MUP69_10400 [Candidatus Atribacteria bacterium]|nr:hypothetical protein [Candidatus Atribacteria bacterium]
MKIIKVNNCGECLYKDTYFPLNSYPGRFPETYKYCRYKYIKTGEIKKIENLNVIAEWCDLDDYKDTK